LQQDIFQGKNISNIRLGGYKMRILMMTNNYMPFIGGVSISVERLSEDLRARGNDVMVVAPEYEDQQDDENTLRVRTFHISAEDRTYSVPNPFDGRIRRELKGFQPDIIHVHHPFLLGNAAMVLSRRHKVPLVFTYHTNYEQYLHYIKPYKFLTDRQEKEQLPLLHKAEGSAARFIKDRLVPGYTKDFCNRCDMIFSPTGSIKSQLEERGIRSQIRVLPTGLKESVYVKDMEASENIRTRYKGNRQFLFCSVSRLSAEKNIDFLFRGIRLLKDKAGDCFRMLLIGDGPEREHLEALASDLGITNNIVFIKSVLNSEIANYYNACDAFLFASKSETQGIVLLEAMAAKNPVVAVRASGVMDMVEHGANGYITEEDEDEWSDKVLSLMNSPEEMKALGSRAYETAKAYSGPEIAARAEGNYLDLLRLREGRWDARYVTVNSSSNRQAVHNLP
jgi:glycosyltransferase involved in cell wall biosynthesis